MLINLVSRSFLIHINDLNFSKKYFESPFYFDKCNLRDSLVKGERFIYIFYSFLYFSFERDLSFTAKVDNYEILFKDNSLREYETNKKFQKMSQLAITNRIKSIHYSLTGF